MRFSQPALSTAPKRTPSRNISQPVYFILQGAEKRRAMATYKAQSLQRDMGVLPRLKSVK